MSPPRRASNIPTLCYLPEHPVLEIPGPGVFGQGERRGRRRLCGRGQRRDAVEVNDPETTDARKALVEMLFSEGNHNCPAVRRPAGARWRRSATRWT